LHVLYEVLNSRSCIRLILVINCDENARIVNEKMKKELQYLLGDEGEEKKEGFLDPISKSYVLKIKKAADD